MRKTLIASAVALTLASGSALAAFDGVEHSSSGGAASISGAVAASSGNGGARVWTAGSQTSTYGTRGSSDASYYYREGHATISGVTAARGSSATVISTRGNGFGAGGTAGKSTAEAGGFGYYDTHGSNPEGFVLGGSKAKNVNLSGGISAGGGHVNVANESGTRSGFFAHSEGNRDGGYRGRPRVDTVDTEAAARSSSFDNSGRMTYGGNIVGSPVVIGGAIGGEWSATHGAAGSLAFGKVGNQTDSDVGIPTDVR